MSERKNRLDGDTISELYRIGFLNTRDIRRLNIVNALRAGQRPYIIADHYGVSKQYVYRLLKRIGKQGE